MSKEYFMDNISDEMIAKLIDKTLRFEKNNKINRKKINLFRIIPVAAMIAVFIGLVNLIAIIPDIGESPNNIDPSANINSTLWDNIEEYELFVPRIVEKDFFENKILAAITNQRTREQLSAYYTLQEMILSDNTINKKIISVYILDPVITEREENILLESLNEYTDLTGNDLLYMYAENGIQPDNYIDPNDPYAHVRFGKTRDILLLDIEWHTPETYLEEVLEAYKITIAEHNEWLNEYKDSEEYTQLSDKEKASHYYIEWTLENNEYCEFLEEFYEKIKEGKGYYARTINGKKNNYLGFYDSDNVIDISKYLDKNGYYIFRVYPYKPNVAYKDENGDWQYKQFVFKRDYCGNAYYAAESKSEYYRMLEDKIIPFCDDLLERGLLTQERYDYYTTFDPLDYYVNLYFN